MKSCFIITHPGILVSLVSAGGDSPVLNSELDKFNQGYDMIAITGQQGSGNTASINQSGHHIYGSISQVGEPKLRGIKSEWI